MSWFGVDLDGTLAYYDGWKGTSHIGEPIPEMVARVKCWLENGLEVRIFTARATGNDPTAISVVERWCERHLGRVLPVTNVKDYTMIELWDDRAVQVIPNTGRPVALGERLPL